MTADRDDNIATRRAFLGLLIGAASCALALGATAATANTPPQPPNPGSPPTKRYPTGNGQGPGKKRPAGFLSGGSGDGQGIRRKRPNRRKRGGNVQAPPPPKRGP